MAKDTAVVSQIFRNTFIKFKPRALRSLVLTVAGALVLTGCIDSGSDTENHPSTQVESGALTTTAVIVEQSYAALHLTSVDRSQYGGFSSLWLAKDCSRMISFSDYSQVSFFSLDGKVKRSGWIEANLSFDDNSRLNGLEMTAQGQLRDKKGDILSGAAESLAWDGKGFLVSFDDQGDIYRYPGGKPEGQLLNQTPTVAVIQNRLGKDNAGLESITELPGGYVLTLWERKKDQSERDVQQAPMAIGQLILIGGQPHLYRYRAEANPGGATTLADGTVVVLEREYLGTEQGVRLRLTRFHPDEVKPKKQVTSVPTITPQVLLDQTSTQYDNFEGVASCKRDGKQWLFVLSDDNGDWPESWIEDKDLQRQKTLLVQFDLDKLLAQ